MSAPAYLAPPAIGPVWLTLGDLSDHTRLNISVSNVGDGAGREIELRLGWHGHLGRTVATVPVLYPGETLVFTQDCSAAEVRHCSIVIAWREGRLLRRQVKPLRDFASHAPVETGPIVRTRD